MSATPPTITGVLVANRGEIARRVFRTARGMGLRCVAVYVDADAGTPYVTEADVAVRLADGGHMDGDAIVAAALAFSRFFLRRFCRLLGVPGGVFAGWALVGDASGAAAAGRAVHRENPGYP